MVLGGGACRLCRLPTLPLAYWRAPIPPTPFPAGRGRFLVFLCKGLRPLHPRGLDGARHWLDERWRRPVGGLPFWSPARPTATVPCGEAYLLCRLPILPLAYLSAPIPLTPFPAGRGRFLVFLCKGLRPLHPRGLDGARHWLGERWRCPVGGVPSWSPARPCHYGSRRGACPLGRLPTLPLAFASARSPGAGLVGANKASP